MPIHNQFRYKFRYFFVKSRAQNHAVTLLPIGALTNKSKGEHLAELFNMRNAGACAFYDYKNQFKILIS